MRKTLKAFGSTVEAVLVAAVLAAAAVLFVPGLFGWQVVTVLSGSMAPTYDIDAVLAIRPVEPDRIRDGDVIAYRQTGESTLVTHRVMAVQDEPGGPAFVTKGDANEDADIAPVAAEDVRGRVVFGVPMLGAFVRAVHTPVGLGALLVAPILVFAGQQAVALRRSRRERTDATEPAPGEKPAATGATG